MSDSAFPGIDCPNQRVTLREEEGHFQRSHERDEAHARTQTRQCNKVGNKSG